MNRSTSRAVSLPDFTNEPGRPLLTLSIILLALFLPVASYGQFGSADQQPFILSMLAGSRTEISPIYHHVSTSDAHEIALHAARTIPVGIERPSLSLQSRISLVHAAFGVRMREGQDGRVRWSAGLLDGDIYRAPVAVGLTVLNYDRIGTYSMEARWLDLRLGPAVRWETDWFGVEPRLVGSIGGSSLRPGSTNFPGLEEPGTRAVHGFDAGYRAEIPVRLNYWFLLSISAGQRVILGDRRLSINRGRIEARTIPVPALQLYARYEVERLALRGRSDIARSIRAGLRVML